MSLELQIALMSIGLVVIGAGTVFGIVMLPGVRRALARAYQPNPERARVDIVTDGGEIPCNGIRASAEAMGQTYDYRIPGIRHVQAVIVPVDYPYQYDLKTGRRIIRVKDGEAVALSPVIPGQTATQGRDSATEVMRARVAVEAHRSFRDSLGNGMDMVKAIVVIAIIAVVAFVGYQWYQSQSKTNNSETGTVTEAKK